MTSATIDDQNMTDNALIYLCREGQQDAFAKLVERYNHKIFNYLYHLSGNPNLAEDLSQEVFLRVYLALPNMDADRPFRPWFFQIAHNCCIDELRRRRKHAVPFSYIAFENDEEEENTITALTDTNPLPDQAMEQRELQEILHESIQQLPIKYRSVTTLRYTLQLKFGEIGKILDMPEPTAKTYFARAKKMLRTILQEKYHYPIFE